MKQKVVKKIDEETLIYRDERTGMAFAKKRGENFSIHPNIHKSGSVKGMKKLGFWGKKDRVVRVGDFSYNTDIIVFDYADSKLRELEEEIAKHCLCVGCISRKG